MATRKSVYRRNGESEANDRQYSCVEYQDWLVVNEERKEDPKIKDTWFHGRMNRSVAEEQLSKSARFDGTFIVRESDAISVDREPTYVISVLTNGETHHVEVVKREDGKYELAYIKGGKTFKSLKKLVEYYRGKVMELEGGGKTKLKYTLED